MNWSYPSAFWGGLLAVPVFLAVFFAGKSARVFLKPLGGRRLDWQVRSFLRNITILVFTVLLVFTAAEPVGGRKPVAGEHSGLDVAVAFDVSRSMLARDIEPDRLTRSAAALRQIEAGLKDARFSLVPFKGDARLAVPMTEDRIILEMWIDRLGPGLSTVPGTNLEAALKTARASFPGSSGRKRIILLVTDGEALSGRPEAVVRELANDGIPVYVLASGTSEGATIPLAGNEYVKDESGRPVVTRTDVRKLTDLAGDTGAACFSLSRPDGAALVLEAIESEYTFAEERGIGFAGNLLYRIFLLPALAVLLCYLFIRIFPWRRF